MESEKAGFARISFGSAGFRVMFLKLVWRLGIWDGIMWNHVAGGGMKNSMTQLPNEK